VHAIIARQAISIITMVCNEVNAEFKTNATGESSSKGNRGGKGTMVRASTMCGKLVLTDVKRQGKENEYPQAAHEK
jgi:hypothetical protein